VFSYEPVDVSLIPPRSATIRTRRKKQRSRTSGHEKAQKAQNVHMKAGAKAD